MLQLRQAPRLAGENLLMAGTHQQQIRQHRDAKGLLDAPLLPAHLVCTQFQGGLEFPLNLLHRPPSLIRTHHLSGDPLVQMGHQDFRRFGADVTPSFTPYHGDVTVVSQTQACAIHPEGFAARGARQTGDPDALILFARHMGHQVFDGLLLHCFPGPRHGEDKAPASGGIVGVALLDHLPMLLGAISGVAFHDHGGGPRWRSQRQDPCTEQRIFRLVRRMPFGSRTAPA